MSAAAPAANSPFRVKEPMNARTPRGEGARARIDPNGPPPAEARELDLGDDEPAVVPGGYGSPQPTRRDLYNPPGAPKADRRRFPF